MCFYIDQEKCPKAKIAEKDIKVVKRMIRKATTLFSPYWLQEFKPNKLYKTSFTFDSINEIEKGFHAHSNLKSARVQTRDFVRKDDIACEFIIPKGSEYYFNEFYEEYVSNQTKWTGRVWRTDRWVPFKGKITDKMKIFYLKIK